MFKKNKTVSVWLGIKSESDMWKTIDEKIYNATSPDLWYKGKVYTPTPNKCLMFVKNYTEYGLRNDKCKTLHRSFLCKKSNSTVINQTPRNIKSGKKYLSHCFTQPY